MTFSDEAFNADVRARVGKLRGVNFIACHVVEGAVGGSMDEA